MISIAQISDTHLLCPVKVGETDIVKQRINNLKRCVDSINNLDPQPDIIIHTGDVTQNGTVEEYKIADSILKKLKQRIFFTPGNRDNKPNLRKIFTQSLSRKTDKEFYIYSIEFKGFKLISIDTFCSNSNKGELTSSKKNYYQTKYLAQRVCLLPSLCTTHLIMLVIMSLRELNM